MSGRQKYIQERCGTIARVDEDIYIGGYLAAANPAHINSLKVTHILKLFPDDKTYKGGYHRHAGVKYLVVDADDLPDYPLDKHFAQCLEFIQDGIRKKGRVLVHCHAGVSRSATIVILHLMINAGKSLEEAWAHLKKVRPVAHPNEGFWGKLQDVDRRATRFRLEGKVPKKPSL
jgi:predicted protein tyrosine phosphatase